jgi:hypothetical protein
MELPEFRRSTRPHDPPAALEFASNAGGFHV